MPIQNKLHNMRPDPPDLRDRIYNPILRSLPATLNTRLFEDPVWQARVRDQGTTQACTGFALAVMVAALVDERAKVQEAKAVSEFSPFMLYYFARRYDEFKSDDANEGSTARAAMKAWYKHGVCRQVLWSSLDLSPSTRQDWVRDGFRNPLGAYYRVNHQSIPDLHAALNETGAVYVTAAIHAGWAEPHPDGTIPNPPGANSEGGHAFLLVGYDEHGFWIQNSWGNEWGRKGFARLAYTDWLEHGMDAWVGQLGVYITSHLDSLGRGLQFGRVKKMEEETQEQDPLNTSLAMLSANPVVQAQQINPYVVDLENNCQLSDGGKFRTSVTDLYDLTNFYLNAAIKDWGLRDDEPIDVALYAHGGLVNETSAAETATTWIPALYASRVFPIFVMWETGFLETLGDIIREAVGWDRVAGASILDVLKKGVNRALDFKDDRLESLVSPVATPIWEEIKENAERATSSRIGGMRLLLEEFGRLDQSLRERLRFHLIGHSAGSIFHAHLLPALLSASLKVNGLYFMAPACRVELFRQNILSAYQEGKVGAFTQFHLSDAFEQADNCAGVYNRSILYLVSNACERMRGRPLLGMEKFVKADGLERNPHPETIKVWDFITAQTSPLPDDLAFRSLATAHQNFDDNKETIRAILERIKRQPK